MFWKTAISTVLMGLPAFASAQTYPRRPVAQPTVVRVQPVAQPTAVVETCGLQVTGPQGMRVVPSKPTPTGAGSTQCIWLIQTPSTEAVSVTFNGAADPSASYGAVRLLAANGAVLGSLTNVTSGTVLHGMPRTMILDVQTADLRLLHGLSVHIGAGAPAS